MTFFYISAIRMDSANQHIEWVRVHEINNSKLGTGMLTSRAFVAALIHTGTIEFRTITKIGSEPWKAGAKVEVTSNGYITTNPNKTTLDNLGNLPTF